MTARPLVAGLLLLCGAPVPGATRRGAALAFAVAGAEDDWAPEFEAVCSRTQDAMALSDDELRSLVRRCDALRPRMEALEPSRRKVYTKRLQLCRDLYQFVLDTRDAGKR